MRKIYLLIAALMVAGVSFAQTDTTKSTNKTDSTKDDADTIKVGNLIIIRKHKDSQGKPKTVTVEKKPGKPSKFSTNWGILDIGFANLKDETDYGSADAADYLKTTRAGEKPFTKDDLNLRAGKTSNINIWIVMQRWNIAKGYLNLKYGVGIEMFNFRYENNISYHKSPAYIFRDSINFTKNKLSASYLSVPFMVNVNTSPGRKKGLSLSAGVSAGYLIGSRNKQISAERGKVKVKGDFDLEPFRLAYIGELGIGPIRLFGSYSMRTLHEHGLKQYPYSLGIRLSNW
ncbi:MAG: outer membrane beta-barrel protein [Segetibacter sp.]|nr:outer membrane beta-barrel protein [Segetibacter sp.]